jgi:putative Mg2+ transporter-C (MgtC) family protein
MMWSAALVASLGPSGEGWRQIGDLAMGLLLSALIGFEREWRQKSAGLRTHTLVGVGAALFMLVSKFGFSDVLESQRIVLDPSRVAAQIVSGIGFLGAGLIFVRRDAVRGLTTAASIWLTAAVGASAGAGLLVLASVTTGMYIAVTLLFTPLARRLPRSETAVSTIQVTYPDGQGLLRQLLEIVTDQGFAVDDLVTEPAEERGRGTAKTVRVTLHVHGRSSVAALTTAFAEFDGVRAIVADDANVVLE